MNDKLLKNAADLMKIDLYEYLDIEANANRKDIITAYRKKAVKCHPDKNPDDPNAAEKFHKLSEVLEILTDDKAKDAYDKVLHGRKAAELRNKSLNAKRRKLKDDLDKKEKIYQQTSNFSQTQFDANMFEKEINRLRKEGSKILEEEQNLLKEKIKNSFFTTENINDDKIIIKVKWQNKEIYDKTKLKQIFNKYGIINEVVVMIKKKYCSAIIEFLKLSPSNNYNEIEYEKGLENCNFISVEWLSGKPINYIEPSNVNSDDNNFELYVLSRMKQTEERKRLIDDLKAKNHNCQEN